MKTFSLKKFVTQSFGLGLCMLALPTMATWTVKDGKILDPNGQPFIFRGVTINHMAAPDKAVQAIKDAAAAGANAVQVEISVNFYNETPIITGEQLRSVITACKDNKVVCVLEPNDVAGYPNARGAASPSAINSVWGYPGIRDAIFGQQDYVIIGMGNQALDSLRYGEYSARMNTYVSEYKSSLPQFLLMIDGSGWGQDASKEMLAFAAQHQYSSGLIYSVEMFSEYTDPEKIRSYIADFSQIGAPLVIGGFAQGPYYHPFYTYAIPAVPVQLPAASVMEYAEQYGVGYFAWNWSENNNPGLGLTTNWNAAALTSWGELAINGANGIKATAKLASHFSSNSSSNSSSSTTSNSSSSATANKPPVAAIKFFMQSSGGCPASVYGNASALESYDPDGDSLSYEWEVTGYGRTTITSGPNVRFSMLAPQYYSIKLTVNDGRGGVATQSTYQHDVSTDNCIGYSSSSSVTSTSSSSVRPSSSSLPSSVSSSSIRPSSASRSSSSAIAVANCSYVINSQWNTGFTAAIRIKNTGAQPINGWSLSWQYADSSKITGSWNATLTGTNPYSAKNLSWNASIQPGQTVEFGFQGSKSAAAASVPLVTGSICQ